MSLMCSGSEKKLLSQSGIISGHKSRDTSRTLLPGSDCFGCVCEVGGLNENLPHSRTDIRKTCLKKGLGFVDLTLMRFGDS